MKRAAIYFFYDKDGIVDSYVPYFVDKLHEVVDYIVVVVNGKLSAEGRKALSQCADDMFVRENVGFDAWAYKDAIEYIGWDQLLQFDELVLANFTIFGPIFPFQEIFARMDQTECDFWGMSTSYEKDAKNWFGIPLKWGHIPETIISNFRVYKSPVLHSFEFRTHWDSLPKIRNYFESNVYHEMELSKLLTDAGFIMASADQGSFRNSSPSPSVYGAYDAISRYRIPVLRRKAFFDPNGSLDYCTDIPREIMRYLAENTHYDCNLIWENLLRTTNLYDLKNWFNWNAILPTDYSRPIKSTPKIAAIFHIYYDDIVDQYLHNIASFPAGTDFYITTDTEEKREILEQRLSVFEDRYHIEYRLVENRGRDVSALLVGCRDVILDGGYDLVCFMHDKKGIGNSIKFACVGQSFSDCCFENVAANANYVNNVAALFESQPRLGMAVPPPPKNANYYKTIGGSWGAAENFSILQKLLLELGISAPIDSQKPPVAAYGTVFWFRPEALRSLFQREWQIEIFDPEPIDNDGTIIHAIERAYGFVAQGQGYYTSVIMNSTYAEQEVTRMTEIAHTYVGFSLQYVGSRSMLKASTERFSKILQQKNAKRPTSAMTSLPSAGNSQAPSNGERHKSLFFRFVRGICPIGLWNLLRRIRCVAVGGTYIEPTVKRGPIKTIVRSCMPRFLWDMLRKAKCKENGWVFVED